MAQWLQHLPGKLKDRRSDPSNGQVWRSTSNPSTLEAEKVPWGKIALLTKLVQNGELWIHRDPLSRDRVESNVRRHG